MPFFEINEAIAMVAPVALGGTKSETCITSGSLSHDINPFLLFTTTYRATLVVTKGSVVVESPYRVIKCDSAFMASSNRVGPLTGLCLIVMSYSHAIPKPTWSLESIVVESGNKMFPVRSVSDWMMPKNAPDINKIKCTHMMI